MLFSHGSSIELGILLVMRSERNIDWFEPNGIGPLLTAGVASELIVIPLVAVEGGLRGGVSPRQDGEKC